MNVDKISRVSGVQHLAIMTCQMLLYIPKKLCIQVFSFEVCSRETAVVLKCNS